MYGYLDLEQTCANWRNVDAHRHVAEGLPLPSNIHLWILLKTVDQWVVTFPWLHMQAGLIISGINAEVMPGQWEFQIGPVGPTEVGDQVMCARWLLHRLGENFGIVSTFAPKPVKGDWNGALTLVHPLAQLSGRHSGRLPQLTHPWWCYMLQLTPPVVQGLTLFWGIMMWK